MFLYSTIRDMSAMDKLAKRLLLSRHDREWNQDELADQAGVSRTYVSDIERGKAKNIGIDVVMALAHALSISPSYLMGEADTPLPKFSDDSEDLLFGVPPWRNGPSAAIDNLGGRLLISRRDLGWTQGDLAEKVGVNRSYISNIESGRAKNIGADILAAMAKALDVSVAYLLGETQDPMPELSEDQIREEAATYTLTEAREAEIDAAIQKMDDEQKQLIGLIQQMDEEQKQQMLWAARLLLSNKPRIIE
jgi:transcriptional regulator with XRE-family HTH domain